MNEQAKIKLQQRINRLQEKLNKPVKYTIAVFKDNNYELKFAEAKYKVEGSYPYVLMRLEELAKQNKYIALFKGRNLCFHK